MYRSVRLMVEIFRVVEHQAEVHVPGEVLPVEVVVPRATFRNHEESKEFVTQDHLHLFKEAGRVLWRVRLTGHCVGIGIALGKVALAPVQSLRSELVHGERTGASSEAASGDNGGLCIPLIVFHQQFGMRNSRHWSQLIALGRRSMQPSQGLHIRKVRMLRCLLRQRHILIGTDLRDHHNSPNLLDHWIVRWTDSIHVSGNLGAQISDADEALEDILRQHICQPDFPQIIRIHIDVIRTQMHVGGADGAHTPLSFTGELFLLVLREGCDDHLGAVDISRTQRLCLQLLHSCVLVLNPVHLLLLDGGWCYIHAQNYILDLTGRQTSHVDVVLLGVVGKNQILELNFDSYPLLRRQIRPNMMRLRHYCLVGRQNDLGPFWVQMQRAEDEDESGEGREATNCFEPVVK